jgi:hypothetical protein
MRGKDGIDYVPIGTPLEWLGKHNRSVEAPPDIAADLTERHTRKMMGRTGIKPAGRRKVGPGGTVGERRRELCALGHTPEQIAEAEGVEVETVLRSMRPSRTGKRGGQ